MNYLKKAIDKIRKKPVDLQPEAHNLKQEPLDLKTAITDKISKNPSIKDFFFNYLKLPGYKQIEGPISLDIFEIPQFIEAEVLTVFNNKLTGEIPHEIGNLTNLRGLNLSYNQLTGEIPREIGNLKNLISLILNNNQLESVIPDENVFLNLVNLYTLDLTKNKIFRDEDITKFPNLTYIRDARLPWTILLTQSSIYTTDAFDRDRSLLDVTIFKGDNVKQIIALINENYHIIGTLRDSIEQLMIENAYGPVKIMMYQIDGLGVLIEQFITNFKETHSDVTITPQPLLEKFVFVLNELIDENSEGLKGGSRSRKSRRSRRSRRSRKSRRPRRSRKSRKSRRPRRSRKYK
jgi:hypothetical protein